MCIISARSHLGTSISDNNDIWAVRIRSVTQEGNYTVINSNYLKPWRARAYEQRITQPALISAKSHARVGTVIIYKYLYYMLWDIGIILYVYSFNARPRTIHIKPIFMRKYFPSLFSHDIQMIYALILPNVQTSYLPLEKSSVRI